MCSGISIPEESEYSCPLCQYSCATHQMLSVHSYSQHKIGCNMRNYVDSVCCPICLRHFHTRENILNHCKKSRLCHINLLARGPTLTDDEAVILDSAERERNRMLYRAARRRHARDHPVIQAYGPWNKLPSPPPHPTQHHPLGRGWSYAPICPYGIPDYS